jgi:hypothetical protein
MTLANNKLVVLDAGSRPSLFINVQPVWLRVSLAVTISEPEAHRHGDDQKDFGSACRELVSGLMDDGIIPKTNDATHVCYLVVMPPGFREEVNFAYLPQIRTLAT